MQPAAALIQSINQSKHISIAPYVANVYYATKAAKRIIKHIHRQNTHIAYWKA